MRATAFRKNDRCVRAAAVFGVALTLVGAAAGGAGPLAGSRAVDATAACREERVMWMTVGTQRFAVTLEDNPTARALAPLLPFTLDMAELNGNEKHARLPRKLPTDPVRPGTIRAGDVLLYGSDTLVVFYETFRSSYSYTPIGRIENSAELAQALGPGSAQITFEMR
jgi:hypothetical protein